MHNLIIETLFFNLFFPLVEISIHESALIPLLKVEIK